MRFVILSKSVQMYCSSLAIKLLVLSKKTTTTTILDYKLLID